MFILDTYQKITCGDVTMPYVIAQITSIVILIIQVLVPIIIIILGMLDLGKAVIAQKEDEIKKGWQTFFKRLLIGMIVFLVIVFVKFIIGLVAENYEINCIDCFVNNNCQINWQINKNIVEWYVDGRDIMFILET